MWCSFDLCPLSNLVLHILPDEEGIANACTEVPWTWLGNDDAYGSRRMRWLWPNQVSSGPLLFVLDAGDLLYASEDLVRGVFLSLGCSFVYSSFCFMNFSASLKNCSYHVFEVQIFSVSGVTDVFRHPSVNLCAYSKLSEYILTCQPG